MRELNDLEIKNLAFLTQYNLDFGLLEPTLTGLRKSIMDATAEYRSFLLRQKVHNYDNQQQGEEGKRALSGRLLTPAGDVIEATASLYRPTTKKGDPRIWFSRMKRHCDAGDILVSIWLEDCLWVLNATRVNFADAVKRRDTYRRLLQPAINDKKHVFEELLTMLRNISARGFIPTLRRGDTGVGHLLETELGIAANSRKAPDYKGVEIKSARTTKTRNQTLFAKVPDWDISQVKSSREILELFGYARGENFKLYCTVSALAKNSQGLSLQVDEKAGLLHETSDYPHALKPATWRIQGLRDTLAAKHADTFWVQAEARKVSGREEIHFQKVVQTTRPIVQQVAPMLSAGTITVDHLISRKEGKVSEQGPLFKINKKHFGDLFPPPLVHDLSSPNIYYDMAYTKSFIQEGTKDLE